MEQIRAFIAIELPAEIKASLAELEQSLRSGGPQSVKWVDPEGIHLTLKFLGNVSPDRLPRITEAISGAVGGVSPFRLQLAGLGLFPGPGQPRVIWVGLEGDVERLTSLQRRIDDALSPLGFSRESRDFAPHLTLARMREGTPKPAGRRFGERVLSAVFEPPPPFGVDSISLMRSRLTPSGAIYTRIDAFLLPTGSD